MKSRFRSSTTSIALAVTLALTQLHAADGTWSKNGDGTWSNTANWSGGTVANGVGATAYFENTLGTRTVSLDSSRVVGSVTFGIPQPNSSQNWILDNGGNPANILTMSAVGLETPSVNVYGGLHFATATISASLSGNNGLAIRGGGRVILSGTNSYTGVTDIDSSVLFIDAAGTLGSNAALNLGFSSGLNLGGTRSYPKTSFMSRSEHVR